MPDFGAMLAGMELPAMRWDHRPEAAEWTRATLIAVAAHDDVLAPACPPTSRPGAQTTNKAAMMDRRSSGPGLLSAVAKYESSYNPNASGGGGRYIGLLQISPRSAAHHGCARHLGQGAEERRCQPAMRRRDMAHAVGQDGVVAGKGNRGVGRDWRPFRKAKPRGEMQAWISQQSYCR